MGSIQALRSEALAARSKDDTELQVSGYLGTVNKSLGNQILNMLDQLQGVVLDRTKAYNTATAGLKQKLEKRGAATEKMVQMGFSLVKGFIDKLMQTIGIAKAAIAIAQGKGNMQQIVSLIQNLIGLVTGIMADQAGIKSIQANIKSAMYDYEKAMSQLGMMDKAPTRASGVAAASAGAAATLDKRDSLMPRYKALDTTFNAGGYYNPNPADPSHGYGYVGTLRRV